MLATLTSAALTAAATGETVTSELARQGLLGVILLAVGFLAYKLITRETARADRAEAALSDLNREAREQMIRALIESATANKATAEALRDVMTMLRDRDRR